MKLDLDLNPEWPLYLRLSAQLREKVIQGELQPGDRLPSFVALRNEYGIHKNTVERAHIELEKEGLIIRRSGSGTFVAERRAEVSRKGVIGMAGFGFRWASKSAYWGELLGSVQDAADEVGQQILLMGNHPPHGWEKADGVMLSDWSQTEIQRYAPPSLPCVSLMVTSTRASSVAIDEASGIEQAVQHLLVMGHRNIAYMAGGGPSTGTLRMNAFRKSLERAGVAMSERHIRTISGANDYGPDFVNAGLSLMRQWLREDWRELKRTALICHNDEIAIGAMRALREHGLSIPHDVSVIGFDGVESGPDDLPKLTTVEIPLCAAGRESFLLLMQQIKTDEVVLEHKVLPVKLQVRESTAPPRALPAD